MPQPADRNLLFGIMALQMELIDRDQLVDGMHGWVTDKDQDLGDVLVAAGAMDQASCRNLVQSARLAEQVLQVHPDHSAAMQLRTEAIAELKRAVQDWGEAEQTGTPDTKPNGKRADSGKSATPPENK